MSIAIGIDLGTSFSSVAAVRDDAVVVVEDEQRRHALPSVVHYGPQGQISVGHAAVPHIIDDPENTVHSAKRMLGRRFTDGPVRVIRSAYLYRVTEGPNLWPVIEARGGPHPVPSVCAQVLADLRQRASRFFGEEVTQAVITVPAHADDAQREQTRIAGKIAGLEVLQLLNEPTAAARAYRLLRCDGRTTAVYDFGGGTFDVSIIAWGEGREAARVLATHGDPFLGGDDVDLALAIHVAQEVQRLNGVDLRKRSADWKRLLLACEAAKRKLSRRPAVAIKLPAVAHLETGTFDLNFEVTREQLDRLATPYVDHTIELLQESLTFASLKPSGLDQVLLVGGSSRMPLVRQAVQQALGKTPLVDIDPETAVCIGAAAEAHRLTGGRSPSLQQAHTDFVEVVPRSFGLAMAGGRMDRVIPRNTALPAKGIRSYTTSRDNQREMRFVILQGDNDKAGQNIRLGEFRVDKLPARPAGHVEVELIFEVNVDGLLRVSARDTSSGTVYRMGVRVADALPES
jgi:molecular chaperone DnaK